MNTSASTSPSQTARRGLRLLPLGAALFVAGCAVGPDYQRPSTPAPVAFKEAPASGAQWFPAAPADALDRGPWWELFGDPVLSDLAAQVEVSNQNVAAAVAAYAQARAVLAQQSASVFPTLGLTGSERRIGGAANGGSFNASALGLQASWEPDLWGQLRRGVEGAQASAQASDATLAAARLSAQGAVATNYFLLRDADNQIRLLQQAVEAYQRALRITQNTYDAGIAAKTDVLQAQTQLASTQANLVSVQGQRPLYEHAIAVLLGKAPADFALAPMVDWKANVPAVPLGVPSALLQRRPDIAAAERAVAAANAQIGVQVAGYYPNFTLSGAYGTAAARTADLFDASAVLWSLGLSATQTLFDAGATKARVQGAEAQRNQAVAQYRQTVLSAFQGVEDQLVQTRSLTEQAEFRREASRAADLTETQLLNQYKEGQVAYTDVIIAQAAALNARQTLSQLSATQLTNAVALIQALGGGWQADSLQRDADQPAPVASAAP
jgi:NodT family efflux transporter outer membrane factor (OMF) lipoprotein